MAQPQPELSVVVTVLNVHKPRGLTPTGNANKQKNASAAPNVATSLSHRWAEQDGTPSQCFGWLMIGDPSQAHRAASNVVAEVAVVRTSGA